MQRTITTTMTIRRHLRRYLLIRIFTLLLLLISPWIKRRLFSNGERGSYRCHVTQMLHNNERCTRVRIIKIRYMMFQRRLLCHIPLIMTRVISGGRRRFFTDIRRQRCPFLRSIKARRQSLIKILGPTLMITTGVFNRDIIHLISLNIRRQIRLIINLIRFCVPQGRFFMWFRPTFTIRLIESLRACLNGLLAMIRDNLLTSGLPFIWVFFRHRRCLIKICQLSRMIHRLITSDRVRSVLLLTFNCRRRKNIKTCLTSINRNLRTIGAQRVLIRRSCIMNILTTRISYILAIINNLSQMTLINRRCNVKFRGISFIISPRSFYRGVENIFERFISFWGYL